MCSIVLFPLALTAVVYWGVWSHDFLNFDDMDYVVNNHGMSRSLSSEGFKWAFAHASNANCGDDSSRLMLVKYTGNPV